MSLLQLIADKLGTVRANSQTHQHPLLLKMDVNPLYDDHEDDDDLLNIWRVPRHIRRLAAAPYYRDPRHHKALIKASKGNLSKLDKDHFQVNVDVQQFTPDEITVKATGSDTITVEGKHEERPDEHGSVYRHFVRRYVLPKTHDIGKVESRLSTDGVLTITAPKITKNKTEEREIPVIQTRKPSVTQTHKPSVTVSKQPATTISSDGDVEMKVTKEK